MGSLCAVGCRQIAGISDRDIPDAGEDGANPEAGACGIDLGSEACGVCMAASCCDELASCSHDLACAKRQACLADCPVGQEACRAACMLNASDFAYGDAVTACRQGHCQDACKVYCGGWEYRLSGCDVCMQAKCCTEATACGGSEPCRAVEACLQDCIPGDWDCYVVCHAEAPVDAVAMDRAFYDCFVGRCASECGFGRLWTCVGTSGEVSTEVRAVDLPVRVATFAREPVQGAEVKACSALDASCSAPDDTEVTQEDGRVVLSIPIERRGYLGRFEASADGHVSVSLIYSPPLTSVPTDLDWLLPTESEFAAIAKSAGVEISLSLGHVVLVLHDCATAPAEGLTLSSSTGSADVFYLNENFVPSPTAKATGTSGIAGFYNISPGTFGYEAVDSATGRVVITGDVTVEAGKISYASVHPR